MQTPDNTITPQDADKSQNPNISVAILSAMMFLLPALGVPSELVLQDTLKSMIAALATLSCAILFLWQHRHRTTPFQWHGLMWLPILLMVYALISMAWSDTYLAASEAIRWFIFTLILWLGLNIFNQSNLHFLIWCIHGGAVVASTWIALQFFLDFDVFPQFVFPASTFVNRNFFSTYLISTLPFSVYALASMPQSRWLGLTSSSIALNVVALVMTGTRSATITMLMIIPVFIVILIKYRQQLAFTLWSKTAKAIVIASFISSIAILGSLPSGKNGNGATAFGVGATRTASVSKQTEYTGTGGSFAMRMLMWSTAFKMTMAHPLTGVGAGGWEIQAPLYQPKGELMEIDYYIHNEYIQLLCEYGPIVGGIFLISLFAYLLITFVKTWRLKDRDFLTDGILRAFTLTSLFALLVVSFVEFPWHLAATTAIFAVCLSLLAGSDARLNIRDTFFAKDINWRPVFSKVAMIFLACSLLLAMYISAQAVRVEYKIVQAIQFGNSAIKLHKINQTLSNNYREKIISNMHEAMDINPHYRKLMSLVADRLATIGDWKNAIWIWESLTKSRPYVAVFWSSMAIGHAQLGENAQALEAAKNALKLQPKTPGMHALEVNLLSQSGEESQAREILTKHFNDGTYDYALAQSGYALGLKTHDWPLAIRALELRNKKWPKQAADGYFRLGNIYTEMQDDTKALESFRLGLRLVSSEEKDNFKKQVPEVYRDKL